MTALGPYISDRDRTYGWPDTILMVHPFDDRMDKSIRCWNLAAKMVDDRIDWDEISAVQDLAHEFELLARLDYECNCYLPEQSCRLCRATTSLQYYEREYDNER